MLCKKIADIAKKRKKLLEDSEKSGLLKPGAAEKFNEYYSWQDQGGINRFISRYGYEKLKREGKL